MRPPTTDHSHDDAVMAAARWLLGQHVDHGIIPELRTRFGLSSAEAIEACREAERLRRSAT